MANEPAAMLEAPLLTTLEGLLVVEVPDEPDERDEEGTTTEVMVWTLPVVSAEPAEDVVVPAADSLLPLLVVVTVATLAVVLAEAALVVLVTDAEPEADPEAPTMAKGKEYWKMVVSESYWIFRP